MSNNKQSSVEDLAFWKNNAEENYITTPISVLKYITELEKHIEIIKAQLPSDEDIEKFAFEKYHEIEDSKWFEPLQAGAKWLKNKIQGVNK